MIKKALFLCAALAAAAFCQENAKRLSKVEALNAVVTKVRPDYPAMARQLKIEGAVELEAVISETGAVETVNIVNGNPLLTRSAADALKRWKFNPATDGGKPVKALAPVVFTFKM